MSTLDSLRRSGRECSCSRTLRLRTIWLFRKVRNHYLEAAQLGPLPPDPSALPPFKHVVVVPISRLSLASVVALQYAASLTPNATAVHVATDDERSLEIEANWQQWGQGIPLVIVESPYRSLTGPLMQYLLEIKKLESVDLVTVILPEYVPDHWWEHILHGQSAQFLKLALLFTPGFVVTSVPVHERTRVAA